MRHPRFDPFSLKEQHGYYSDEEIVEFAGELGKQAARESAATAIDGPFDDSPEAAAADFDVKRRRARRDDELLDPFAKPRPRAKRVDLSPFQRRWFEANGYAFARVEQANAWGAVTVDLWGFADWLAIKAGAPHLLVQTTTLANTAARIRKALAAPELAVWLASGGRFEVHGWEQPGGPGTRWQVVIREVTDADAAPERLKRGRKGGR